MTATAKEIALVTLHYGGRRSVRRQEPGPGMGPETVTAVCAFLGIIETPDLHEKLWELLGAFEDTALAMIAKLPKKGDYVAYEDGYLAPPKDA